MQMLPQSVFPLLHGGSCLLSSLGAAGAAAAVAAVAAAAHYLAVSLHLLGRRQHADVEAETESCSPLR